MLNRLKYIRLAVALAVFIIFSLAFLGIPALLPNIKLIKGLTFLQFIPSILKFTVYLSFGLAGGYIIILLTTLFFGRIYCSSICPLGIFQDLISRIGRRFRKQKNYRYSKPFNKLRFSILIFVFLISILGSSLLLNLLDPYSIFGKIFSGIFHPLAVFINDTISNIFEKFEIYAIAPVGIKGFSIILILYSFICLLTIGFLSFFRGRLFCNTICPVGAALGLISKYSIFKIKIDELKCTQCGKCSNNCKSECIDIKTKSVDFSRCVTCYNCVNVCPENCINYLVPLKKINKTNAQIENNAIVDINKRNFFKKSLLIIGTFSLLSFQNRKRSGKYLHSGKHPLKNEHFTTPPGSYSLSHFISKCTACQLCVNQCPSQVLQPSFTELGITSLMVPFMDYGKSFCNYECTKCSEVCPNGAIIKISKNEKKATQLGKVVFVKENCVVYADETSCGACSEHCPTKAVQMVPYKNGLTIPQTDVNICVGCGACEFACPTRPNKSIYVEGALTHGTAFKPKNIKQNSPVMEDFPF
jgi:ferredoxin